MWSEENVQKKSRSRGGRKLKSKKKGGGSYLNDVVVSFESLERFPEGFTADRGMFYVVGLARLRQLRIKKGSFSFEIIDSYLVTLFENESSCKAFHMKMTLICMKMKLLAELIFILTHFDTEAKGNSEMSQW